MELLKKLEANHLGIGIILDSLADGLIILDKDQNVIFENEGCKRILKVPLENTPLKDWPAKIGIFQVNQSRLIHPEEMPLFQAFNGIVIKDVRRFIRNDFLKQGTYISMDAIPLFDDKENVLGVTVYLREITQKVSRERKIVEERIFFQKLLDFIPGHIIIKDLEGNYTFVNKYFQECFPDFEVNGKKSQTFFPKAGKIFDEESKVVTSLRKEIRNMVEMEHPDGSIHHYRTIRFPILDNNDAISGTCTIAFDETQVVEQEKAIESERIKSINASKLAELGTLAAEIGHEINNPLGIIKTSVAVLNYMLDNSEPVADIRHQLGVIDKTSTRITEIVSALRHISRDSSNEKKSTCSVRELIDDVRALCGTKFKIKNIELIISDPEEILSFQVNCLRIQLSQVLINVLVNASDATEGIKNAWVKIMLDRDREHVYFKVTDSGPGVPEEVREHLFEPYFTTKPIGAGTGLGLSISRDIMQSQGGDIYLDNTECSNCFVIKLPKSEN